MPRRELKYCNITLQFTLLRKITFKDEVLSGITADMFLKEYILVLFSKWNNRCILKQSSTNKQNYHIMLLIKCRYESNDFIIAYHVMTKNDLITVINNSHY